MKAIMVAALLVSLSSFAVEKYEGNIQNNNVGCTVELEQANGEASLKLRFFGPSKASKDLNINLGADDNVESEILKSGLVRTKHIKCSTTEASQTCYAVSIIQDAGGELKSVSYSKEMIAYGYSDFVSGLIGPAQTATCSALVRAQ